MCDTLTMGHCSRFPGDSAAAEHTCCRPGIFPRDLHGLTASNRLPVVLGAWKGGTWSSLTPQMRKQGPESRIFSRPLFRLHSVPELPCFLGEKGLREQCPCLFLKSVSPAIPRAPLRPIHPFWGSTAFGTVPKELGLGSHPQETLSPLLWRRERLFEHGGTQLSMDGGLPSQSVEQQLWTPGLGPPCL